MIDALICMLPHRGIVFIEIYYTQILGSVGATCFKHRLSIQKENVLHKALQTFQEIHDTPAGKFSFCDVPPGLIRICIRCQFENARRKILHNLPAS